MLRTTLKGLLDRKLRTAMSALAIVLGVAMVSGTYVLTDTLDKAFGGHLRELLRRHRGRRLRQADRRGLDAAAARPSPRRSSPRSSRSTASRAAAGQIFDLGTTSNSTDLIDPDGEPIGGENSEGLAFGVDPEAIRFTPLNLAEGELADGPGRGRDRQVDRRGQRPRRSATRSRPPRTARKEPMTITGTVEFGGLDSLGNGDPRRLRPRDRADAGRQGGRLRPDRGRGRAGRARRSAGRRDRADRPLEPPGPDRRRAGGRRRRGHRGGDQHRSAPSCSPSPGIALFVGAFVIFNTLSMTIAQRIRELATLRTLGASRLQILGSLLLEGLVIGLIASAGGVLLGVALAKGLTALFDALGLGTARRGHRVRAAHGGRRHRARRRGHARGDDLARPASDPGAADRRRARGRNPAAVGDLAAAGCRSPRCSRCSRSRWSCSASSATARSAPSSGSPDSPRWRCSSRS